MLGRCAFCSVGLWICLHVSFCWSNPAFSGSGSVLLGIMTFQTPHSNPKKKMARHRSIAMKLRTCCFPAPGKRWDPSEPPESSQVGFLLLLHHPLNMPGTPSIPFTLLLLASRCFLSRRLDAYCGVEGIMSHAANCLE